MTKDDRTEKLKELRDEIFNLKSSPLFKFRTENNYFPVIGEGNHYSDIMFIGEAPGESEAKKGRPFCGASGRFLDVMIESVGMERKDVYITNLVKDRPPENRDPSEEEIKLYAPFLDRQLKLIKPTVIATLGRYSMNYIMEKFGLKDQLAPISKIHGKMFRAKIENEVTYIVCLYHPAVALYNGSMRETLINDFKEVVNTVEEMKKEKKATEHEQLKIV